jgi:hypothetical protein
MKTRMAFVILAVIVSLSGYVMVHTLMPARPASATTAPSEQFPILPRFELPHNYGFFIGDPIPLTLVVETTNDVVLDLANLPRPGELLGFFEVRDLHITSATLPQTSTVYRAAYTLQYFGPTPLTAPFGPLEILYALRGEHDTSSSYTYKRLLTQPAVIHMARISPHHPTMHAPQIKGPMPDQRTGFIWLSVALGAAMVLVAVGGWGKGWYQTWRQHRMFASQPPTAAARALHMLSQEAPLLLRSPGEPSLTAGGRLDTIVREYLQTEHGVPAFTLTPAELAAHLHDHPEAQAIVHLVEQCDALKYQPPTTSPEAEQRLWSEAMTLFEKLQKGGAP